MAELYRMKIVEFRIAALTTQTFGKVYGFFSLDCTIGSGYELHPIVGYCSASAGRKFLTSGYNNNASFDDNGRLVISNPSSATTLIYKGIIIGRYIED